MSTDFDAFWSSGDSSKPVVPNVHHEALAPIQEALSRIEAKTAQPGDRRLLIDDGLRACREVLEAHPHDFITQDIRRRVKIVLHILPTPEMAADPFIRVSNLSKPGEEVISIREANVDPIVTATIAQAIEQAIQICNTGRNVDFTHVLKHCDTQGPFRQISTLFSPEERAAFSNADLALMQKFQSEFIRLFLGARTEENMERLDDALENMIVPLLPKIRHPLLQQRITECVNIWRRNRSNPWKNLYYRSNTDGKTNPSNDPTPGTALMTFGLSYFSLGKMPPSLEAVHEAGYSPGLRAITMKDPENGVSYDFIDAISLTHEIGHVLQHTDFMRTHMRDDLQRVEACQHAYTEKEVGGIGAIFEDEVECAAIEAELLIARIGFGNHDIESVMESFGIDKNNNRKKQSIAHTLEIAAAHFSNSNPHTFSPALMEKVRHTYTHHSIKFRHKSDIKIPE